MSDDNQNKLITPSIDLERSELRYIFYTHDYRDLVRDLIDIGFQEKKFAESPFTKTIYFGSRIGLKPGLSVKARVYDPVPEENLCNFRESNIFNLLEIKSTVDQDDFFFHGLLEMEGNADRNQKLINQTYASISKDILFRIQRATEDGLLRDSTLKTKSRVKKTDISTNDVRSNLKLSEIITLLCSASDLDDNLSQKLKTILSNRIRPLFYNNLIPHVMTQYKRHHFLHKEDKYKDKIRITIDPGVEYYDVNFDDPDNFLQDPSMTAEYLTRERFYRLEIKTDPSVIRDNKFFERELSNILRKYGCLAYISKKWSGATLVSERHIEKQAFWRETFGKQISGFFPVDPNWFSYGQVTESLFKIIRMSNSFSTYEHQPRILVKNQNYVKGYLGVPIPSLALTVEGPKIAYNIPSQGRIVKMIKNKPEFYIIEEDDKPVRSTLISSKKELDKMLHPSIQIEGYSFFRSYGFLVRNENSNRVYKLTIERKRNIKNGRLETEIYCKLRYVGNEIGLSPINKSDIYAELQIFYEEFYPSMETLVSDFSEEFVNRYDEKIEDRG
ncbi:MAG: VTC domain-containing protein [Candidatus Lokiarchaeota archaeon]|nr:VTC domain-containing protein [Candidatus Lokiarchaeota archaeon]MBD3200459.1 VTC domain-containing protein [Candidatus Lokiarchaeota archaeon]